MDSRKKIAKSVAFPGCCGVSVIKNINPKTLKRKFTQWLKEEDDWNCLGGLTTTISKVGDRKIEKCLKDFGFKILLTTGDERIWYRRLRFNRNYW